jgi:hypothetical protein
MAILPSPQVDSRFSNTGPWKVQDAGASKIMLSALRTPELFRQNPPPPLRILQGRKTAAATVASPFGTAYNRPFFAITFKPSLTRTA